MWPKPLVWELTDVLLIGSNCTQVELNFSNVNIYLVSLPIFFHDFIHRIVCVCVCVCVLVVTSSSNHNNISLLIITLNVSWLIGTFNQNINICKKLCPNQSTVYVVKRWSVRICLQWNPEKLLNQNKYNPALVSRSSVAETWRISVTDILYDKLNTDSDNPDDSAGNTRWHYVTRINLF